MAVLFALGVTPGPTPDDLVTITIVGLISTAAAFGIVNSDLVPEYDDALILDTISKIEAAQDDIICVLYNTPSWLNTQAFGVELIQAGLSAAQLLLCQFVVNVYMLSLLRSSAYWWPSFNTIYLEQYAGDCCQ